MAGLARLTRRTRPEGFAQALADDPESVELTEREQALVAYAAKLTRTPAAMVEADLAPLRAVGLGDRDLLDANLVVGYFAYVNRLADGLGVRLEDDG